MNTAEVMDEINKLPSREQREIFAALAEKLMREQGTDSKRWLGKKLSFDEACDLVFRENRELLSALAK